jgi:2-haloacid dehalogenase
MPQSPLAGAPRSITLAEMALRWVLFDLNGTLLDPGCIAESLGGEDADREIVAKAFSGALLLSMAATLSGSAYRPLDEYLAATLERELHAHGRAPSAVADAAARASAMDPFDDADAALQTLGDSGLRLGVLTNSTSGGADASLRHAGLRERFEIVIGSEAVGVFKPHPDVYRRALSRLAVQPQDVCLVAAHAWDLMGAKREGFRTGWVARAERWLVRVVPEPDVRGTDLRDVAQNIANAVEAGHL